MRDCIIRKALLAIYNNAVKMFAGRGIGDRFPAVRSLNNIMVSLLQSDTAEVHGHRMYLDQTHLYDFSITGIIEPEITDLVMREVKDGDVVLDLGASIGYYTLLFAKLVGAEGKVFAFEPDPESFALLKKNVEINGYQNVILVRKAVSNKTGSTKLYTNNGTHTICELDGNSLTAEIESISLDDYFRNDNAMISFIKMDIEGAEGRAVEGMTGLLRKNKDIKMVAEFWPVGLKSFGLKRFLDLLQEQSLRLYHIDAKEHTILPLDAPKLLENFTAARQDSTNLYCIKEQ